LSETAPGPLALVGGDELRPGNEEQDRLLARAALERGGPAFVLATAAAGERPDLAVAHAQGWFRTFGLAAEELPATTREQVADPRVAEEAAAGSFFYLVGGDPRRVAALLAGTPVWEAIASAWRDGAALAGSSAGAMALAETVLIPGTDGRAAERGLGLVPGCAVIPHFDTFGRGWVSDARDLAKGVLVGLDERTAVVHGRQGWRALGRGSVTLIGADGLQRTYTSGETVEGMPAPHGV
jgi:cyanophycinase